MFEVQDVQLVTDNVSYELVRGATVDYVQELIKSTFEVNWGLQPPLLLPSDGPPQSPKSQHAFELQSLPGVSLSQTHLTLNSHCALLEWKTRNSIPLSLKTPVAPFPLAIGALARTIKCVQLGWACVQACV